jgi:hypothetical protein
VRELCEGSCRFKREDLIHRHAPTIQPLKHGELAGTETKNLSMDVRNGRRFLIVVGSLVYLVYSVCLVSPVYLVGEVYFVFPVN